MNDSITIARPDDWHVHFRDQELLSRTVLDTAQYFSRALVMPNLVPPLTTLESLLAYRERISSVLSHASGFEAMMSFYLNEALQPDTLKEAKAYPFILGAKLYPAGVTTNSEAGTKSIKAIYPLLETMQDLNLVLQVHGEVNYGDIFEREACFIENVLKPLTRDFPKLRIVLEHISTKAAVDFVQQSSDNVAATITIHHLLYNRNQLLAGGLRPHYYCLPILKSATEQQAVQAAALSGNPKFFAGTDSAPHEQRKKENACGCAGIYSAPFALPLYCQFFAEQNSLPKLESFVSHYGADFYQLERNKDTIKLFKKSQTIPESLPMGNGFVIPIAAGETIKWSVYDAR